MEPKLPKNDVLSSEPAAKKPYEAPLLKEWGTLKDITLAQSGGKRSDSGGKKGNNWTN
jgi:hypothetical protein